MAFDITKDVEGAEVIVAGDIKDGDAELMEEDRFPFSITMSDREYFAWTMTVLRHTYKLGKGREVMQIRSIPGRRMLITHA